MMNKRLLEFADRGYTIVTATNRFARYITEAYARECIVRGSIAWESADILPWPAWIKRTWEYHRYNSNNEYILLDQYQQGVLWKSVISDSRFSRDLLHINPVIAEAVRCYRICTAWKIPVFPDDCFLNRDAFAFRQWHEEYRKRLDDNGWIDADILPEILLAEGHIGNMERPVVFAGFDYFTPLQSEILSVLESTPAGMHVLNPLASNRKTEIRSYPDGEAEMSAAAAFARSVCEKKSERKLGIIVPALDSVRDKLESVFERILDPGSVLLQVAEEHALFNISLGKPLTRYAPVQSAITILKLGKRVVEFSDLSLLLRSPFVRGSGNEWGKRANIEMLIRQQGETVWYVRNLARLLEHALVENGLSDAFVNMLKESELLLLSHPDRQRIRDWASMFSRLLDIFGWPGDRDLNSVEYQVVAAWNECLARFAALDRVLPPLEYHQAVEYLSAVVDDTHFQPETRESGIQILNTTGAAAMQFDCLWIMGLHQDAWPPPVQHFPFIPPSLMESAGLPFPDHSRNTEYARVLLAQLAGSAEEVILSYPRREKDYNLAPSPMLKAISDQATHFDTGFQDFRYTILQSAKQEYFRDDTCTASSGTQVSGGTGILSDQSRCPFRSFAKHRLYAESPEDPGIGLDAMDRGILVHLVLQHFWRDIKTQEKLTGLPASALEKVVNRSVRTALKEGITKQTENLNQNFIRAESTRLIRLLHDWLENEINRASFRVIDTEFWHKSKIGNIDLTMRIDRIDQLADGNFVIIDYKSGDTSTADWSGARPVEPQLPVYAVTSDPQPAAVVYATIKKGQCGFSGTGSGENIFPDSKRYLAVSKAEWESRLTEWNKVLSDLAEEFENGIASVSPVHRGVCDYCDLHSFCRIYQVDHETRQETGSH